MIGLCLISVVTPVCIILSLELEIFFNYIINKLWKNINY